MKITDEIKRKVLESIDAGMPHRSIAREFGMGVATVSLIRNEKKPHVHINPKFDVPLEEGHRVDPIAFLDDAIRRTEGHAKDRDYHKIVIDTKEPIAIMKAADFHFGGLDVDYEALKAHAEFILNTPNMYMQLFGDDINLMIMHRVAGARHDGWTPEEQVYWLESFVDALRQRGKLLSMCSGNHSDEFTERNAGFGIVRMLMKHKIPYFRGLGYIDLVVGKQTYPMGFCHKTRFNSFMNQLHGNKRIQQMSSEFFGLNRMPPREIITAHTHNPAYMADGCTPDQRVWLIKCGTFKTNCLFSQRYYGQGRIGCPTVVYYPDRLEHLCFPTPWEANRYMLKEKP